MSPSREATPPIKPLFPIQPSSEQVLNTQSLNESFCNCKSRYNFTPHANTNRPIFGIGGDTPMMSIELNNQKDKK
jgi:hypothetical protein